MGILDEQQHGSYRNDRLDDEDDDVEEDRCEDLHARAHADGQADRREGNVAETDRRQDEEHRADRCELELPAPPR